MKVLLHPVAVVLIVAFIAGCGSEPSVSNNDVEQSKETNQKISDVVNSYKGLKLMTPEAVFVNPELAMLCVGASKEAVEYARVAKGPHANCSVKIYMNELAAKAFETNSSYPVGCVDQLPAYVPSRARLWSNDRYGQLRNNRLPMTKFPPSTRGASGC